MLVFPSPQGADPFVHAERVVGDMRAFAARPTGNVEVQKGRPARSEVIRNAVRAAVHYLHDQGGGIGGGWKYRDRAGERNNKRSANDELEAVGPAKLMIEVCAAFDLNADAATIKGCHEEYIKYLGVQKRSPLTEDYMPASILAV